MLPPPTTRHNSWPRALAAAISPARPDAVAGSIPNWPCPINASPDSFSRMRLKRRRVMPGFCPQDATRAATPLWRDPPLANCQTAVAAFGDRFPLRPARPSSGPPAEGFLLLFVSLPALGG